MGANMQAEEALVMSKTYVKNTLQGMGALQGEKGEKGDTGAAGKSAYEIWLEQGNTGTEEDFLNSLNKQEPFYYKNLPTEPIVFSQGMVSVRKDTTTGLRYEYVDETSTNRLKTDEYIHCNDLYTEIMVPSEYTLMTRTYTKDNDGNMVALTNIPEFNGSRTIKDIIYNRFAALNANATQEEVLEYYKQNNLYFRFCLKRLDNADFTPETNEVVVLKYTEEANKEPYKSQIVAEDYLYNSIYYDYARQIKNMTAVDELLIFVKSVVEQSDFDGTLVLPRKTYLLDRTITIDTSKIKVFDGNNSEFIMQKDVAAFEIIGSLDSSMSANPNTLNAEIMDNEPNTIIRNCIIRGKTNEDGTYTNNGIGISISGAIKTKVENCYIHHMKTGIQLLNVCRDISICNNHIYAITGNGISLEDTNIHQLNINSNFISYCMNCLYVRPTELANLQMNGNDIEISSYPAGSENARCLNFDMSTGTASNTCFEIEICGNTIQGHSVSSNLIQFLGGVNPIENVSIVGNHISNSKGTGITIQDCRGIAIQGNTMKAISGYIYELKGTVSYINIQGNTGCENCNNLIYAPANSILNRVNYINNLTTGDTLSVLSTQQTDVVIQPVVSSGATDEQVEEAVENYLTENPISGLTEDEKALLAKIVTIGNGTKFLADDGTYKTIETTGSSLTDEELAEAITTYFENNEDSILSPTVAKETYVPKTNDIVESYWQGLYDNQLNPDFKRYAYGIAYENADKDYKGDITNTPMPVHINNNAVIHGMLQVVADTMSRWQYENGNGGHLLELWDKKGSKRLTGMMSETGEDNLPEFALQMWNVSNNDFGWIRIGSDNFRDDKTPSGWGGVAITGTFAKSGVPLLQLPQDEPQHMPYYTKAENPTNLQLENDGQMPIQDGTIFLGKDGILRIKVNGTWKKFMLEEEGESCTFTLETTRLGDLITECESLNAVDYSGVTFANMQTALSEAKKVYGVSDLQKDYGRAWEVLKKAYDALVSINLPDNATFYSSKIYSDSITKDITLDGYKYMVAGKMYFKIDGALKFYTFVVGTENPVSTYSNSLLFTEKDDEGNFIIPKTWRWDTDTSSWVEDNSFWTTSTQSNMTLSGTRGYILGANGFSGDWYRNHDIGTTYGANYVEADYK